MFICPVHKVFISIYSFHCGFGSFQSFPARCSINFVGNTIVLLLLSKINFFIYSHVCATNKFIFIYSNGWDAIIGIYYLFLQHNTGDAPKHIYGRCELELVKIVYLLSSIFIFIHTQSCILLSSSIALLYGNMMFVCRSVCLSICLLLYSIFGTR